MKPTFTVSETDRAAIIHAALEARQNAYAPYSNFQVGAALLTKDGAIFHGANVENASYGLTICAERAAATGAIVAGHREFLAIAVASPGGASPCGACRQFLAEFGLDLVVLTVDADQPFQIKEATLTALLPDGFRHAEK
jgi:cytidine deaminase